MIDVAVMFVRKAPLIASVTIAVKNEMDPKKMEFYYCVLIPKESGWHTVHFINQFSFDDEFKNNN